MHHTIEICLLDQLSQDVPVGSGTRISRQIMYRRLADRSLYAQRPLVCVPLTQFHKKVRLSWSRGHYSRTEQDWRHVLFSDSRDSVHK